MARKRRRFTPEFRPRVALEALRERDSVQAIAARQELHPNQMSKWKRQLLEGLPEEFAGALELSRRTQALNFNEEVSLCSAPFLGSATSSDTTSLCGRSR